MTGPDLARLGDVPLAALTATLFARHCHVSRGGAPDPVRVDPATPTRWHTDQGTLYLGEDDVTVWAEHCRWSARDVEEADPTGGEGLSPASFPFYGRRELGPPVRGRALVFTEATFDRVADLTTGEGRAALRGAGVDPDRDLLADDFGPCPAIAKTGCRLGWQAIRAPSAARPAGVCVAVFRDWFPPRAAFDLVVDFARPIVAVAFATRYRAGERPGWLGEPPARVERDGAMRARAVRSRVRSRDD